MNIKLLSKTQPDIKMLLATMKELFGENFASTIDARGETVESPPNYIEILHNIGIKNPLQHFHYSFLCGASYLTFVNLSFNTPLKVQTRNIDPMAAVAIISGTMEEWFTAICLNEELTLINEFHRYFESEGFSHLWNGYQKRQTPDRTYKLEQR